MSTTVSYKNNTITTVSNSTKTLYTSGTWLEDDIEITDVSSNIVIIDTPDSHGGTIREITSQNVITIQSDKIVNPSASQQTITPDTGYDAFASVKVNPGYSFDDISSHNYSGEITTSVSTITYAAFYGSSITGINAPNTTKIRYGAFRNCASLINVNLPNAVQQSDGDAERVFSGCSSLQSIILPKWTHMWNYFYENCTNLRTVVMPALNNSRTTNFNGCTALKTVDLKALATISASFFSPCTALDTLILRRTSIVALSNVNAFSTSCPFASGGTGGIIYIPKVLYDHLGDGSSSDYKAATNWSAVDGYGTITWAKIEGSQYENYYADGTAIPTT